MNRIYKNYTEAEVQFELGSKLKLSGFEVFFERIFLLPKFGTTKRTDKCISLRADIVLVLNKDIKCLIEVKSGFSNRNIENTRQYGKYKSLGLDFMYCLNETEIDLVVDRCKRKYLTD